MNVDGLKSARSFIGTSRASSRGPQKNGKKKPEWDNNAYEVVRKKDEEIYQQLVKKKNKANKENLNCSTMSTRSAFGFNTTFMKGTKSSEAKVRLGGNITPRLNSSIAPWHQAPSQKHLPSLCTSA